MNAQGEVECLKLLLRIREYRVQISAQRLAVLTEVQINYLLVIVSFDDV